LWRNPGVVEKLDLASGPGGHAGAPRPPFRFIQDDSSGTAAKVLVRDARGHVWSVKFGDEVKAETFASRIAWAAGYYAEPTYFVKSGRILGAEDVGRADRHIEKNGDFTSARFEPRTSLGRYLPNFDWTWEKNPFVGTRQLNGLKTLVMLTSNWDNKDGRDAGSNTGLFQRGTGPDKRWVYAVVDWGGSMGKWVNIFTREKWNCEDYAGQTRDFIKEVKEGEVRFGFSGQHDNRFKEDIRIADVRWLLQYVGRLTDTQIRSALLASGANRHEVECFTRAFRTRVMLLRQAAYPTASRARRK
jgi:hypothetical protein